MKEEIKNHIGEFGSLYLFILAILLIGSAITATISVSVIDINSRHHLTIENNEIKGNYLLLEKENETLKEIIKLMRDAQ